MNNKLKLIIDEYGTKRWRLNGELHREDGPAIIYKDGTKEWYLNGRRHRIDGPAAIYSDGSKYWYINDKRYTYEEWFNKLTPEQQINSLWNSDVLVNT